MKRFSLNSEINVPAPAPVNIRSSTFMSTATIQPQFLIPTPTDDQQFDPEDLNTLSYYVSNFSLLILVANVESNFVLC